MIILVTPLLQTPSVTVILVSELTLFKITLSIMDKLWMTAVEGFYSNYMLCLSHDIIVVAVWQKQ